MKSEYFNKLALSALNRLGNILIPQSKDFPSFSSVQGLEHIDDMVAMAPREDIKLLNLLLTLLGLMPSFVLKWLMKKCQNSYGENQNGALSVTFRELNLGLRGLLFACYYSGKVGKNYQGPNPIDIVGFDAQRVRNY